MLADWRYIPSQELERKELRQALREAIAKLSPEYREVLILRDVRGMSIAETAAATGVNEGLVKVRLFRARLSMQKLLAPQLGAKAARLHGMAHPKSWWSMTLDCKHVWAQVSDYIDGIGDAGDEGRTSSAISPIAATARPSCDSTRNILVLVGDERTFEVPVGFGERLHGRLQAWISAAAPGA